MKRSTHIIIQILGLAAQLSNALLPIFQGPEKAYGVLLISFVQGAVAIIAQAYNTDGTPQTQAFTGGK